jgi:hypothetical protein
MSTPSGTDITAILGQMMPLISMVLVMFIVIALVKELRGAV